MTMEAASWWNAAASSDSDINASPTLPDKHDLVYILPELSPVLHTALFSVQNKSNYWEEFQKILKILFKNDCIPNPTTNFPEIVNLLYKNRNLLKPSKVSDILPFIDGFCPDSAGKFFICDLFTATSDPHLSVKTLIYLHEIKYPKWVEYINQHGNTERVVDMLVGFLIHATDYRNKISFSEFHLDLAYFITEILTYNNSEETVSDEVISSFYSRLLKLIKYSEDNSSITFVRCAIKLNESWLPKLMKKSPESAATRISSLLASTPSSKVVHDVVLRFALNNVGKYIPAKRLIVSANKQGLPGESDLLFVANIAHSILDKKIANETIHSNIETAHKNSPSNSESEQPQLQNSEGLKSQAKIDEADTEAVILALRLLWRRAVQSKVQVRAASYLACGILSKCDPSGPAASWFSQFATGILCFIKLASSRAKYKRRCLLICAMLSEMKEMGAPDWSVRMINEAASAAYQIGKGPSVLRAFFKLQKVNAAPFEADLAKFSAARIRLKCFPFKQNSAALVEAVKGRPRLVRRLSSGDSRADDSLQSLGLSTQAAKYVFFDFEGGPVAQQQCIFLLEDFIDREQQKLERLQLKRESRSFAYESGYSRTARLKLRAMGAALGEADGALFKYQTKALTDFIQIAIEIANAVSTHAFLFANLKLLARNLNSGCASSPEYLLLKRRRSILKLQAIALGRSVTRQHINSGDLRFEVHRARRAFDESLMYAPPSPLDEALHLFCERHPGQMRTRDIGAVIASGDVGASVTAAHTTAALVAQRLRIDAGYAPLLVCSLLRNGFDWAFPALPEVGRRGQQRESEAFARACEAYVAKDPRALRLRPEYFRRIARRPDIGAVVSAQPAKLGHIEFLTNPVDVAHEVHRAVSRLPGIVGATSLCEAESVALLAGVIAADPPSNAVAVAAFVDKWQQALTSLAVVHSVALFVKAVSVLAAAGSSFDLASIDQCSAPASVCGSAPELDVESFSVTPMSFEASLLLREAEPAEEE